MSQPEIEAFIRAAVQAFIQNMQLGVTYNIYFYLEAFNGVPWIYRAYLVTDFLLSVGTYFPEK
jgi:hypothetical protein